MPTSAPIEKILIIGSGPVKIHQTASLDNAACQACDVFKHSGLRTVMVHCDPSAIATDMETTDRTYMMPLTEEVLIEIIRKEKPDSLLPSVGGPAAMSLAKALFNSGITQKMGIRLLGITDKTLALIDDPASFSDSVSRLGLMVPQGQSVDNIADAANIAEKMGYPVFVRTSGLRHTQRCGIVYNVEELHERLSGGRLAADATDFFRIEQNLSGYREIEVQAKVQAKVWIDAPPVPAVAGRRQTDVQRRRQGETDASSRRKRVVRERGSEARLRRRALT